MTIWLLRTFASLFLGALILGAVFLLFFTFAVTRLADDDIYADALSGERAYQRVYSEVLTPDAVSSIRQGLFPDLALLPPEDMTEFARTLAPPRYLRGQTEDNLRRLSAYANGESGRLRLYLELSEPLERAPVALEELLEARSAEALAILALQSDPAADAASKPGATTDIADALEAMLTGDSLSQTLAEYTGLTREELLDVADEVIDQTVDNPEVPLSYRQAIRQSRTSLRESFAHGSTSEFLAEAVRVVARPAIEETLQGTALTLDDKERLDLMPLLAQVTPSLEESELQKALDDLRSQVNGAVLWGRILSLALLTVSVALLVLVHWGRPRLPALWTAGTLATSGALLLGGTLVARWQGPGAAHRGMDQWLTDALPWMPGLAPLGADVVEQALRNYLASLLWPAAIPLFAGALLLAGWLAWERWKPAAQDNEQISPVD